MPQPAPIPIGDLRLDGAEPVFILGPCVIESEDFHRTTAIQIADIARRAGARWILKASYDKANRSSIDSFRGMGLEAGCALLAALGAELGVPTTTDVHSPAEAHLAAEWIDPGP